jgi:ribosomal-protein-alanine N-acetyltransferase
VGNRFTQHLERIEHQSNAPGWSQKQFAEEFRLPYSETLGACVSDVLVGFIVVHTVYETGHIVNFAVDPEWRRKGVGSELLLAALRHSMDRGCSVLTLEVRESNLGAQSLYLRFGFEVLGYRARYYGDNGEDALIMTLQSLDRHSKVLGSPSISSEKLKN